MERASIKESGWIKVFSLPVIVAALGYFVDIYDLVLFSIVRVPSLKSLGLQGQDLINQGVFILNMQMVGMLIGALQSDPDMQALVNDPAILNAIQSGDISTLIQNPSFMKLLNNPRVREIEKSLQQGGTR